MVALVGPSGGGFFFAFLFFWYALFHCPLSFFLSYKRGKTTAAKLLMGLYYADEGSVLIDSIDMKDLDISHLRNKIGILFLIFFPITYDPTQLL